MPDKVSVKWQMLFSVLGIVAFWAFYRIGKLKQELVIWGIIIGVGFGLGAFVLPESTTWILSPIGTLAYIIANVYYIRKWSIEWNKKIVTQHLNL